MAMTRWMASFSRSNFCIRRFGAPSRDIGLVSTSIVQLKTRRRSVGCTTSYMSSVTCKTCTHGNTDSRRWHLDQPASAERRCARTRWVGRRMLLERASSFSVMAVARLCLAPAARSFTHITRADPSASAAFHSLRRHTCAASGLGGSGHVSPAFMSTRASTRKIRFSLIRRRQHRHAIHRPRLHAHPHAQLRLDSHHKVAGARHPLRGS